MGQCLSKNLVRVTVSVEVSGQLPTHPSGHLVRVRVKVRFRGGVGGSMTNI